MIVGFGWDVHPLAESGRLVIGGVLISESLGVVAHSDGDVLCHAIADALVGVVFGKDIGELFPESPENENMDSLSALSEIAGMVENEGFRIVNVDCTVVFSRFKLSPFRPKIASNLKRALSCDNVSVKFKSGNSVGEVGKGKAIESFAVVLLEEIR